MELGNLMFGNSRGEYPVECGAGWEEELYRLFDVCAPERDDSWRTYGVEFENNTFVVMPYYWGDCTCGYDEKEKQWYEENEHEPRCYQIALRKAKGEWLAENPGPKALLFNPSAVMQRKKKLYDKLCAEFGLDREFGCAVHCTCDYKERWTKFYGKNKHNNDCPIVKPNFLYKPTGFAIQWYKYPLRDSRMNQEITLNEFRDIISDCIESFRFANNYRCCCCT